MRFFLTIGKYEVSTITIWIVILENASNLQARVPTTQKLRGIKIAQARHGTGTRKHEATTPWRYNGGVGLKRRIKWFCDGAF